MVKFIFYMLGIVMTAGISIFIAYFTGQFIDRLIHAQTNDFLLVFSVIFILMNLAKILLGYVNRMVYAKFYYDQTYFMSCDIIRHIHRIPLLQLENMDSAYLKQRISQDNGAIINFTVSTVTGMTTNIITFFVSLVIMFTISWSISLLLSSFVIVYALLFIIFKKPLYNKGFDLKEEQGFYFSKMYEQLYFARFVKIHSAGKMFKKRLQDAYEAYRIKMLSYMRVSTLFSSLDTLVLTFISVFLFIIFGFNIVNGNVTVGEFVIFTALSARMVSSLSYFFNLGETYQDALVSYNRVDKILKWQSDDAENGTEISEVKNIKLTDVDFSFGEKKIIHNFGFDFLKGSSYAIIGENGKGKSTLINLLMGIYPVNAGSITYDGIPISNLNKETLRNLNIGVVEQEPILLNDTIYHNINLGYNNEVTDSKLDIIFELLDFKTFIQKQEKGLQTVISEKSTNISGGEKQKIALARLFLKDPGVMILDEPTSALDETTTMSILKYLNQIKKDKIIIIISHTPSVIEQCDFIIKL